MQKVTIDIKLLEKFIKDFIKENNRLPKMKEFTKQNGSQYGRGLIERQYGGIQNICKILIYKDIIGYERISKQNMIQ